MALDKALYKKLFTIVTPIAFQFLTASLVTASDAFMLGFLDQDSLSASSLAGQVSFVFSLFYGAFVFGSTVLAAQYWGKGDRNAVEQVLAITMRYSLLVGIIFTAACLICPRAIMHIFTSDEKLIAAGARYLRVVSPSYVLGGFTQAYYGIMKVCDRAKLSSLIGSLSVFLNIGLNALLIFGIGFFPKMNIMGAALATDLARVFETVFVLIVMAKGKCPKLRVKLMIRLESRVLHRDYRKYTLPILINQLGWGGGVTMYSVIMGHLGEDIVAANSVVNTVRQLGSVLCFGMAYGGAIVVGKYMGAGDMEVAERNASRLARVTIISGVLGAVLLLCCYPILPYIADLNETAAHYRNVLLFINSYSLIGASINTVLICGIFRAGGDAKFGFVADCINMWAVSVPLGLIAAFVLKLPPLWVYFILFLDEFEKMPFVIRHYYKKGWLRNITRD